MYSSHQQRAASVTAEYHVHLQPRHFYLQSLVTSVEIGKISPRCLFCHNTPCISRCKVHDCL